MEIFHILGASKKSSKNLTGALRKNYKNRPSRLGIMTMNKYFTHTGCSKNVAKNTYRRIVRDNIIPYTKNYNIRPNRSGVMAKKAFNIYRVFQKHCLKTPPSCSNDPQYTVYQESHKSAKSFRRYGKNKQFTYIGCFENIAQKTYRRVTTVINMLRVKSYANLPSRLRVTRKTSVHKPGVAKTVRTAFRSIRIFPPIVYFNPAGRGCFRCTSAFGIYKYRGTG